MCISDLLIKLTAAVKIRIIDRNENGKELARSDEKNPIPMRFYGYMVREINITENCLEITV